MLQEFLPEAHPSILSLFLFLLPSHTATNQQAFHDSENPSPDALGLARLFGIRLSHRHSHRSLVPAQAQLPLLRG